MKYIHKKTIAAMSLGIFLAGAGLIPTTSAATIAELQAQINTLIAQITQLQNQSGTTSISSACPYTWSRNLTVGTAGADVLKLQQFLNSDPATVVAVSGVGSKGLETQNFGPLTAAAVTKFQNKYKADVLTPSGLSNGTGYFGPSTMAKANMLCKTAPVVSNPTTPTTPSTPTTSSTPNTQNEASLERYKTSSGDDTNLEEGQKNAQVMDVEFNVKDSDITISRVDVAFDHQLGDETDPWKTYREVALYVGNKKVSQINTSNKNAWTKNDPYTEAYKVRLSGLDIQVDEGDTAEFSVAVTLQSSIDGADTGLSWDVFIPDSGIRARDTANIDQYIGSNTETVNIDINQEGAEDELSIKSSDNDPDATMLALKDNGRSDWYTVFAFTLDTDESKNDIEVRSLPIALTVSSSTAGTFINDVRLQIDGKIYDDVTITDGTTNKMVFMFDNEELVIDAGDTADVALEVRFNTLAAIYEGTTIQAAASSTEIVAEGADDLTAQQLSGAATSDLHTLQTKGVVVAKTNTSAELKVNATNDITDDQGVFKISFDVTAVEADLYINRSAASSTALGIAGANYVIRDSAGNEVMDGIASASLTSSAKTIGNRFVINEGKTERFTLTVAFDPTTADFYQVQLHSINWATTNVDPTTQQKVVPVSRFETEPISI